MNLGATLVGESSVRFRVWAPKSRSVSVNILGSGSQPLDKEEDGYYSGTVAGIGDGTRYLYRLDDGRELPDPASRFQPEGVHGPSQVVDPDRFTWCDGGWTGMPPEDYLIYELHVGTFTGEGTFESIIPRLDHLLELGVTALELMPAMQFPGKRNWGYDGVYPFAPHNGYGGPDGLKRLIDACHSRGLAVILDQVYNHLGPEGNYGGFFGEYTTDRYRTDWGDAINYDGPESDHVRHFIVSNALYWITEFHADALRLDAIHGIYDFGARHILEEIAAAVHKRARLLGRAIHVIAESDQNDVKVLRPHRQGGYNMDAQWSDDFHHSLHALLTGEKDGYYRDFGKISHLAKAIAKGFVYDGVYSHYRRRRHGSFSGRRPARQFVVFSQNHDQVGNRMNGERLTALVPFESLKLAAGVTLLSPAIPLLFMGEEYGEIAPFLYFVDHSDPALLAAVRTGRKEAFRARGARGDPPDPADPRTFLRSKLDWNLQSSGDHRTLHDFYRALVALRKRTPALATLERREMTVRAMERERLILVERRHEGERILCLFAFAREPAHFPFPAGGGRWRKLLDSADSRWSGPGSPLPDETGERDAAISGRSLAVYRKEV